MDLEKLSNFIIPIVLLILYFFLSAKANKKEPEQKRPEPSRDHFPPKRAVSPQQAPYRSSPKIVPMRPFLRPLEKKVHRSSYASKLIKGNSLRRAFLMKEILNRPYE